MMTHNRARPWMVKAVLGGLGLATALLALWLVALPLAAGGAGRGLAMGSFARGSLTDDPVITYGYPTAGGPTQWYNADPGAVLDIDFASADNLHLAWYRILVHGDTWYPIFEFDCGQSPPASYTELWSVDFGIMAEGGNQVDLRVQDCAGDVLTDTYVPSLSGFLFRKDTQAPPKPASLASPTHPIGDWSKANVVEVTWADLPDPDPGSGLLGYSVEWSPVDNTEPDTAKDVDPGVGAFTSPPLADGQSWWFHIRALDNAGNAGPTDHWGPFWIDTAPPTSQITDAPAESYELPFTLSFTAADSVSGLDQTCLWYKVGSSGTWADAGRCSTGTTGTFTFTPTAGPGTYYFESIATDRAGNTEAGPSGHGEARTMVKARVYLPLVTRAFWPPPPSDPLINGDFELGDATGWTVQGDSFLDPPLASQGDPHGGTWSLRLGNPAPCEVDGVTGDHRSIASQTIAVPDTPYLPTLTFWYRLYTYDHLKWGDGTFPGDRLDVYVGAYLVLRDNYDNFPKPPPGCKSLKTSAWLDIHSADSPWGVPSATKDLGWLDLTPWKGQSVEIRFELVTRADGYYSTWAYVDDVTVQFLKP